MNWFTESPGMLMLIAGIVIAGFLIAVLRTGRLVFLAPAIGVAVLAIVLLLVERAIVTEREMAYDALMEVIAAVEANDVDGVLAHIAPDATEMRSLVADSMARFKIYDVRVTDAKVNIREDLAPPRAQTRFVVRFSADDLAPSGVNLTLRNRIIRFVVEQRRDPDGWMLTGYGHDQPYEPGTIQYNEGDY